MIYAAWAILLMMVGFAAIWQTLISGEHDDDFEIDFDDENAVEDHLCKGMTGITFVDHK